MYKGRIIAILAAVAMLAMLLGTFSGSTSAVQPTPTASATATTPLMPDDMRATAYAMLTQAANLDDATATALAQATVKAERKLTKDGKPMTDEQIAHDKALWDAVKKAQKELDAYAAPYICGPSMIKSMINDAHYSNLPMNDFWADMNTRGYLLNGDWGYFLTQLEDALDKALKESIGPAPDWAPVGIPSIYDEAIHLDQQYPGCSDGAYNGDI